MERKEINIEKIELIPMGGVIHRIEIYDNESKM